MLFRRAIYGGLIAAFLAPAADSAETVTNSIGMKLVLVPAGEFMMGASEDAATTLERFPYAGESWLKGETPRHRVRIASEFYMGAFEVTLGQFLMFYHDSKCQLESQRDGRPNWGYDARNKLVQSRSFTPWSPGWQIAFDHPAVYISWNDAAAFCEWLSKKEDKRYRLPTEAEWEYACRAGTSTLFYNGDNPEQLPAVANVADAAARANWPKATVAVVTSDDRKKNLRSHFPFLSSSDGYVYTAPVGRFQPNAFGLYDMHGNVWEWCSDFYARDYYSHSPIDDPSGPETGEQRVLRGGGWFNAAVRVRASDRASSPAHRRFYMWGFRVVRERPPIRLESEGLNLPL